MDHGINTLNDDQIVLGYQVRLCRLWCVFCMEEGRVWVEGLLRVRDMECLQKTSRFGQAGAGPIFGWRN